MAAFPRRIQQGRSRVVHGSFLKVISAFEIFHPQNRVRVPHTDQLKINHFNGDSIYDRLHFFLESAS